MVVAPAPDATAYQAGACRLVQRLSQMRCSPGTTSAKRGHDWITKERRALNSFANELANLSGRLDDLTTATTAIEEAHNRSEDVVAVGADGSVTKERLPASLTMFKAVLLHMRELAASAREAAGELPNSRRRLDLPFAAETFVHLRSWHGFPRPSLYGAGDDVAELRRILEAAGIQLSDTRVRNLLSTALGQFDPHLIHVHVREFL